MKYSLIALTLLSIFGLNLAYAQVATPTNNKSQVNTQIKKASIVPSPRPSNN